MEKIIIYAISILLGLSFGIAHSRLKKQYGDIKALKFLFPGLLVVIITLIVIFMKWGEMSISIMYIVLGLVLIILPGIITMSNNVSDIVKSKIYLDSIDRNGPEGLILELFQINKKIEVTSTFPNCLRVIGIYDSVFYICKLEDGLELTTINHTTPKLTVDGFKVNSKLLLDIFDYIYNNCDNSRGVEWVTRYFIEYGHIEITNINDSQIGMVVTTNTGGSYLICRMALIMSITEEGNFKYISEYPIYYKNSKVNKTREIVHNSFMKMATELIK